MTIRSFSPPRPIEVIACVLGDTPALLRWRGRNERVSRVLVSWELAEGWWRGKHNATRRRCFRLLTRSGLRCVVFRDLEDGRWYLEQIDD